MSSGLLVAYFEDEDGLLRAAREARAAGLKIHDAYTPYAVHGLDKAMGQRGSRLPWVTLLFGLTGTLLAFWFQRCSIAVADNWPSGARPTAAANASRGLRSPSWNSSWSWPSVMT